EGTDPRPYRVDVTDPKSLPGGEKLRVDIRVDRPDHRPGEPVDVTIRVTDAEGKPAAAEVSLGAVDASVYSFGEERLGGLAAMFDDPHPASRFYGKSWRSSVGSRVPAQRQLVMNQDSAIQKLERLQEQMAEAKSGASKEGLRSTLQRPILPPGEMPVA